MRLSPTDTWLLLGVVALIVIAFYLLIEFIAEQFIQARNEQAARERRRACLRQNINALIESLVEAGQGQECVLLDRALQDSIVEYRVLR